MRYEAEHLAFLAEGFRTMTARALTVAFNERFGLDQSLGSIKTTLNRYKIRCHHKKGEKRIGHKRIYTEQQHAWLVEHGPNYPRAELTRRFNEAFGLEAKPTQVTSYIKNHGIQTGRTGLFEKGHQPWNTGTKGVCKPNSGCFRKGSVPVNIKPLGHERICKKDGYIQIKIAEPNPYTTAKTRYKAKHLVIWEAEHGPIPPGHIVCFIDGDKMNCTLSNLEMISKAEHCRRNKMQLGSQPEELKPTVKALAKLVTRAHEVAREQE